MTLPMDIFVPDPSVVEDTDVEVALQSLNQWQLAMRRFLRHRMALIGLTVFCAIVLIAIIGPMIAPYDPIKIPGAKVQGGDAPSLAHLFGTDDAGRDVYTNIVNGAHVSLAVGFFATVIAGFIGIIVGAISGAVGGFWDNFLMRIVDV